MSELILNAFSMNSVGHSYHGLWTHPEDRSTDYRDLAYWTELAKTLEAGLFDAIFLADILGVYDIYGGNIDLVAREAVQLPVNDPLALIPAMAAVTEHLGFGVTVNISQEHPYTFARRLSTLDHLSRGRLGWNIVTGYLDSAARAVGRDGLTAHDQRYDQAQDYLELCYKLWEYSWAADAVKADRQGRLYADPAKIRAIRHKGPFYQSQGYHLAEPSPQRTPLLFQAGASGRGQKFSAQNAECIFIAGTDKAAAKAVVEGLRANVAALGRARDSIRILTGINVITGATEAEAQEKYRDYLHYASPEAGLAHFSASTGVDLSRFEIDDPLPWGEGNAIQSASSLAKSRGWTKRALLQQHALGGRYPLLIGSGAQVAKALVDFADETGVDGFNLARLLNPASFTDVARYVVPELQELGRYKTAYRKGSLRHKIFGQGDHLPQSHIARQLEVDFV